MGTGASAQEAKQAVSGTSLDDMTAAFQHLSADQRAKLKDALAKAPAAGGEAGAVGAGGDGAADEGPENEDGVPVSWGWPKEPQDAGALRQYVTMYTRASKQEEWDEALAARSVGGTLQDFIEEKAFANLMLNKEGTGEEKEGRDHQGVDPRAYKKGKWYRFMNAKGDCWMYVHNYTLDIQAAQPDNYHEMTSEEEARLRKLGVYIKDLPERLQNIYDRQKRIPIVFCSDETSEALKIFAGYAKDWQLLDCTKLKRVNADGLEHARKAIVNAMKNGTWLMIYLGDVIPEIGEKICTSKNRTSFPLATFTYGSLVSEMVKENIYHKEDMEANLRVVRDGFRVCMVLQYDNMTFEMSSFRKEDMQARIPNFHHMEQVRCYADLDVKKILGK